MGSTKHWLYLLHWLSQSKNCPDGKVIMFSVSMPQSRSKLHLEKPPEIQAKAFVLAHTDSWPKHEILTRCKDEWVQNLYKASQTYAFMCYWG